MDTHLRSALGRITAPLARQLTSGSARILMYHRFSERAQFRRLSAATFERQIDYLMSAYEILTLSDLVSRAAQGAPLTRAVALTFDDGHRDFLEIAYPVLLRRHIPATIYVVSGLAEQRIWLWSDAIQFVVARAAAGTYTVTIGSSALKLTLGDESSRNEAWERIANICLLLTQDYRNEQLKVLFRTLCVDLPKAPAPEYAAMSWDELRSLDAQLIDVGAHTDTHPILSLCSEQEQEQEIRTSKRLIENALQRSVTSFCYPNGQPADFTEATANIVQRNGFTNAVVSYGGFVSARANPYVLQRLGAPASLNGFRNAVDGVQELVAALCRSHSRVNGK